MAYRKTRSKKEESTSETSIDNNFEPLSEEGVGEVNEETETEFEGLEAKEEEPTPSMFDFTSVVAMPPPPTDPPKPPTPQSPPAPKPAPKLERPLALPKRRHPRNTPRFMKP